VYLVFSDVNMPGSINGIELHHRVRRKFRNIKTILTSGNLGSTVPDAEMFLPKPYPLAKAVEASTRLLKKRG
jgi:two-component SAPR family response regulator